MPYQQKVVFDFCITLISKLMDKRCFVENAAGAIYKLYFEIGQTIIKVRMKFKVRFRTHFDDSAAKRASVIHEKYPGIYEIS